MTRVKNLLAAATAAASTAAAASSAAKTLKSKFLTLVPPDSPARTASSLVSLFSAAVPTPVEPEEDKIPKKKKTKKKNKKKSDGKSDASTVAVKESSLVEVEQHGESASDVTNQISSILEGSHEISRDLSLHKINDETEIEDVLSVPWFIGTSPSVSQRRKEIRKERKSKWISRNTQARHFDQLIRICAEKLGTVSTFEVLSKLGRGTGIKECNSLIKLYVKEAKSCTNQKEQLIQIQRAVMVLKFMSEQGFQIEEESYAPLLMFLIDMKMVQEFQLLSEIIKNENPESCSRIGYHTMLLYIRIGDEAKILDLCHDIKDFDSDEGYQLAESYLLAFCEKDRTEDMLWFLKMIDITRISTLEHLASIFKSLGRSLLETRAEDLMVTLKTLGSEGKHISSIIFEYVSCMPNLEVEDVISKFSLLHNKVNIVPCAAAYDKLIAFCCSPSKVHAVITVINQIYQFGLSPSCQNFQSICGAIEQSGEFDLVRAIYSVMRQHKVVPKDETVKSLIYSFTKMSDFTDAHDLLDYLVEMDIKPQTGIYNALLVGYFRENNTYGASRVLRQMEDTSVERDAETFSHLIANSKHEDDIVKYHDEMKGSGIKATKQVLVALINAFANCGKFDKAKKVIVDHEMPLKHLSDVKSVLVSALAANGEISDALEVYNEIKQSGFSPQNKATLSIIDNNQLDGELDRLLQLLEELDDTKFWFDAAGRIVIYCIQHNQVNSAVELLKQMKEKDGGGAFGVTGVLDQAFSLLWEKEPTDVQIGLELLHNVKEYLHLHPSRTSFDFLLSACGKAKDSESAWVVWAEYNKSGLPLNALSFLRMYQVLLATGELKAAEGLLSRIPKDDPHVCAVIKASKATYLPLKGKKKKTGNSSKT